MLSRIKSCQLKQTHAAGTAAQAATAPTQWKRVSLKMYRKPHAVSLHCNLHNCTHQKYDPLKGQISHAMCLVACATGLIHPDWAVGVARASEDGLDGIKHNVVHLITAREQCNRLCAKSDAPSLICRNTQELMMRSVHFQKHWSVMIDDKYVHSLIFSQIFFTMQVSLFMLLVT